MKFSSDNQRKAVFANMFKGSNSKSKVSSSNVTNFESKSPKKRLRKGLKTYGKAQGMRIGIQTLSQVTPPPTQFSYAPLSESPGSIAKRQRSERQRLARKERNRRALSSKPPTTRKDRSFVNCPFCKADNTGRESSRCKICKEHITRYGGNQCHDCGEGFSSNYLRNKCYDCRPRVRYMRNRRDPKTTKSESRRKRNRKSIIVPKSQCYYHSHSSAGPSKSKSSCPDCGDKVVSNRAPMSTKGKKLFDLERRKLESLTMENNYKKKLDVLEKKGEEQERKHQDDEISYLGLAKTIRDTQEVRSQWLMSKRVREEIQDDIRKLKSR